MTLTPEGRMAKRLVFSGSVAVDVGSVDFAGVSGKTVSLAIPHVPSIVTVTFGTPDEADTFYARVVAAKNVLLVSDEDEEIRWESFKRGDQDEPVSESQ